MVNDKYVVKYLDPRTGKYEYATIKDVGDLQKLNTKVKTSIVDAINSISTDGIGGLRDDLNAIGETIKSLEDGTLELGDFKSIDDVVSREIEDAINSLKLENSGLLQLTKEEINKIVSDAESEYRDNIATSIRELETSKTDLVAAREKMITIGKMLENANIDYSNLTQVVDNINLYITDIIEKTDFDMVNGIVSDYKTAVTQTQDGWGVDASKNMLSYLTGRVKNNETSLNVQHGLIEAKVGKDEFQYMTVDNLPAGKENMLHNTSDLRDWGFSSAFIFKSADDYRFTSIVQADSAGENITGTTDELEQGVTYAISTYVNVQNKNKEPGQKKYAPTDGLYTATVIIDGDTIELNNVVEDNSALDGWKRVSGTFIAKRTAKQDIKFYVTAFNRDTQVGYLSAPKFEKGSSATSWVPHIEDNVSTMLSQNAVMRVLSDRITSSVEEVRETKDAFETATSTFDQMADGFELNTNKLTEVLDKYGEVTGVQNQQASELKVLNESITSKVWKQDINATIDTINIDTSNRIVNSAFNIYSYDEQTGKLKLDYWDSNTGFEIKKHSQSLDNYLYAKRSGATSVNPISIKSSPFALRDGEKILFNFEYLAVGNPLDNDNVFTLEMYDNNDVRVGLQEFRLSELKKEFLTAYDVGDSYKYNGTYIVKNSSVVKGTITLKLPKNGELWLTKVMLQNAGIGTIGWTPSSVDNQIIQSKLSTEINQLADSIELVATDERLDAISGLLVKKDGKVVISPEAIISRVTSQELGENGLITQTSLKQTEDNLRFDLVDKDGVIQTINASAEGLLIDFDKVHIDGEVIARMISAQAIDVTQGFRLTDNNGNTLLAVVNDNGTPTLSITKEFRVKIGEVNDKLDVTIVGVVEEYYHSVDPDEPIGGRWTSTPNAFQGGDNRFIWKRTKIIYQSGDTSYYPNETGINITGSWEYEKESVTAEVVKALDSAESAKELAVSEANQALADANKYADQQDALITQQVTTSVSDAISKADQAKQIATDSYNNAVAETERLVGEQSTAFNKKFEENTTAMSTLSQATKDAEAKAQSALTKAGANANLLTTHQNTLNTIKNTTIPNINSSISDAMAEAKSALSSASSAMDEAKKADGKIADYVTKNGLVNGTTVDSKIDDATGEISKKITTVESKIPTGAGINLIAQSAEGYADGYIVGIGEIGEPLVIREFNMNTLSGYIDIGNKGISEPFTFSKQMTGTSDEFFRIAWLSEFGNVLQRDTDNSEKVTIESPPNAVQVRLSFPTGSKPKMERGSVATPWTPAPEDNYTQEEFKIFESTYKEDVKGINSTLTELSNKKLDGTTYTDFYTNEYKKTAQGVTDTYAKVNKIIDANGNSTDSFAKAVYDKNATRQSADFKEVTKDLVKTATYTAGINGINQSITTVQGKLDNMQVGGRNLLRGTADFDTSFWNNVSTARDSTRDSRYKQVRVDGDYTVAPITTMATQGWNFEVGEDYVISVWAKSEALGNKIGVTPEGSKLYFEPQVVAVSEWRRFVWKFKSTSSDLQSFRFETRNNERVWITQPQIENGSVPTDWSPAPEDMLGKADFQIFKGTYESNDQAIKNRLTAIDSGKEGSIAYRLNATESTASGNKTTISNIKTKPGEQITGYQTIKERSDLYERVIGSSSEAGVKQNMARIVMTDSSFQTEIVDKQDLRTAMASGTGMTADPYFAKGANGIGVYDNGKTGTITVKRTKIPSTTSIPAPKGSGGYRLDIAHGASSATTPNRGGLARTTMSWANGTVVVKFVALLPTGRSFSQNNNPLGTGYTTGWLTDNKGTGKWETYMYYYRFGSTGSFSSFGHLSVTGSSSAFTWYLSEYDIINVNETSASKITQLSDNINLKVSKDKLISEINLSKEGVRIAGKNIQLDGNVTMTSYFQVPNANIKDLAVNKITGTNAQFTTMITKGLTANVITSTMIKADDAMFTKLFATKLATDKLVARGAWITNANIVSLDASKITAGTINSARINAGQIVTNGLSANVVKSTHIESSAALIDKVFATTALINRLTSKTAFINSIKAIDISASKITGTNSSFVQSSWNAINSRLSVTGSELKYTHSDGSYTRINANGIQTVVGGSSYQHNYLTHIANVTINSGSAGNVQWVQLPDVFKGKQFRYFMGVTDIYGALGDGAYNENKMVLKRFVLIKSPKHNIDYANARIPILGYAHYVNTENRTAWFRALQGIVVAQF